MTALTMTAQPGQDTGLRPVPWRRMAWVTWRPHRAALAGVAILLAAARSRSASPGCGCSTPMPAWCEAGTR